MVGNLHEKYPDLKMWVWGNGSVSRVFAMQALGSEFKSDEFHEKPGTLARVLGRDRQEDLGSLRAGRSSW